MSLISLVLTLLIGVGKLGIQHSVVRFSHEIRLGKYGGETLIRFYGTVFDGFLASAIAFSALWIFFTQCAVPQSWLPNAGTRPLLLIVTVLIVTRIMESPFTSILRSQEHARAVSTYAVLKRYGSLVTVLIAVGLMVHTVTAFFAATILSESASLIFLAIWFTRQQPISLRDFSPELLRSMLAFGLPMAITEISYTIFSSGDRYVIQALLGPKAVGIYSAAYNLCDYLQTTLLTAILAAVQPVLVRTYEEHGIARTASFIRQSIHAYVLIAAPMVAGFSAVAGPMLTILASAKYGSAAALIPWIVGGMALGGLSSLASSGLYIKKQATLSLVLIAASALLNITLNIYLVPIYGTRGSAIATLLSYVALGTASYLAGLRHLVIQLPLAPIIRAIASSVIMYLAISRITFQHTVATLAGRILVGIAVYGALIFLSDLLARNWIVQVGKTGAQRLARPFREYAERRATIGEQSKGKSGANDSDGRS